jgi:branched-chain amino acid transport system substrate-binding protein
VKIGVLHSATGALAVSGVLCRDGALAAIQDINSGGGINSLDGARLSAVLGDARSQPLAGAGEVETMNHAGACAIVGGYSSAICLAASQAAARCGVAYPVDLGAAESIVERELGNTFRTRASGGRAAGLVSTARGEFGGR